MIMGSIKALEEKVRDLLGEEVESYNIETAYLNLVDRLDGVAREILRQSDYGRHKVRPGKALRKEVGKSLIAILALCNTMGSSGKELLEDSLKSYRGD